LPEAPKKEGHLEIEPETLDESPQHIKKKTKKEKKKKNAALFPAARVGVQAVDFGDGGEDGITLFADVVQPGNHGPNTKGHGLLVFLHKIAVGLAMQCGPSWTEESPRRF